MSEPLQKYYQEIRPEAGCDEAGRGCLAGPVMAAAVIIPEGVQIEGLNDSKQLSKKNRESLRIEIESKCIWAVGSVSAKEIDKINILNASFLAMHRALDQLKEDPGYILVDGNRFKAYHQIPHTCIVKGDAKFLAIAAASILAKTHRDEWMEKCSEEFPEYLWNQNMGYPTKAHRDAIKKHGVTRWHRRSFALLPVQTSLF